VVDLTGSVFISFGVSPGTETQLAATEPDWKFEPFGNRPLLPM